MTMRTPRSLLAAATSVLLVGGVLAAAAPAQAAAAVTLPGTAPAWLAHATALGPAPTGEPVHATIVLAPRGGLAAAQALAESISTPGSSDYHAYLTREQYAARFDPADAVYAAITSLAQLGGFTVTGEDRSLGTIDIAGTIADADRAFGSAMTRYEHDGQTVIAPSVDLTLPAAVSSTVLAVQGLDTTDDKMQPLATNVPAPDGYRNSTQCSKGYGTLPAATAVDGSALPAFGGKTVPYSVCGYTGAQLRSAYEKGSTLTGAGVGIAIVDAYNSPTIASDAAKYAARHGDPAYTAGQFTATDAAKYTDTSSCDASGWFGEQTLDVEAAHAMAPGAVIHYYGAVSCGNSDLLSALSKAVNDPAVDIVSNSWGSSTELFSSTSGYEKLFAKAAAIGVSVLFSSGDNGDSSASVGFKTVGYPASSPHVTTVGGTATAISATGVLTSQTGWGTNRYTLSSSGTAWTSAGYQYGAGGGTSSVFSKPSYQKALAGSGRRLPDIAMDADPTTGMLIGQTQKFSDGTYYDEFRIGGTSLASPLFAGMLALAIQSAGGADAGFLNPTLYAKRSTTVTDVAAPLPDKGDVRADYTNGENASGGYTYTVRTFNTDSSLKVGKGWDPVTGLGVPNTAFFGILK